MKQRNNETMKQRNKETIKQSNNKKIKQIFMDEMKRARDERRIVVFNPGMFPNEFLRFMSLNIMVRSIRDTKNEVFIPATEVEIGRPRSEWTDWELNKDRMFMAMRELGELLNMEMKSDDSGQSSLVKKAILNYIRKARQYDVGFLGDAQRIEEIFKGVRVHGDVFWIKYGPRWLFGEAWEWLFDYIYDKRQKILESTGWNYDIANEKWPRIEDLGPNWAYAVRKEANRPELVETPMPDHHHWRPSDNFSKMTGIHWKFLEQGSKEIDPNTNQPIEVNDNTLEMMELIMNPTKDVIARWKKEYSIKVKGKPSWDIAFDLYQRYVDAKLITTSKVRNSKDALRIWIGRQKPKQSVPNQARNSIKFVRSTCTNLFKTAIFRHEK